MREREGEREGREGGEGGLICDQGAGRKDSSQQDPCCLSKAC